MTSRAQLALILFAGTSTRVHCRFETRGLRIDTDCAKRDITAEQISSDTSAIQIRGWCVARAHTILLDQVQTWNFPDKRLRYQTIPRDAEYVDLKVDQAVRSCSLLVSVQSFFVSFDNFIPFDRFFDLPRC